MDNKIKYLQFPLFLLRDLHTDKEKAINKILSYGIYQFAIKMNYQINDVAKQLMYGYYRKSRSLTNDLLETMQSYIDSEQIDICEDYNGFVGALNMFNPEIEIEQLLTIFNTDIDFKNKAIEYYKIKQAYEFLGINGNFDNCLMIGKQIQKTIPEKEPFPMVSKNLLFEFRDNDKSEFDLMQFATYISIHSILGIKSNCKTNKEMIICRAFGYSSKNHLPKKMNITTKELFDKYRNRYHFDKIIKHLELNWNIITYSNHIRGLYVANKNKITLENLILNAETKKMKTQFAKLKDEKNEAKKKILQHLNKEQQLNKINN